jgi:hypothetical protein
LIPVQVHSQSEFILTIIDSLIVNELNYKFDSNLTSITKPYPLFIIDGYLVEKETLMKFDRDEIKSIKAISKSDSLAFQMFHPNSWGGIIIIETSLGKTKLKKKLWPTRR